MSDATVTPLHFPSVDYTIDDDGIHLRCGCGWSQNMGYSPSLVELQAAFGRHSAELTQRNLPLWLVTVSNSGTPIGVVAARAATEDEARKLVRDDYPELEVGMAVNKGLPADQLGNTEGDQHENTETLGRLAQRQDGLPATDAQRSAVEAALSGHSEREGSRSSTGSEQGRAPLTPNQ